MEDAAKAANRFHLILNEGARGHHVLFSPEMIRMTFEKDPQELSRLFHDNMDEINRVLNESMIYASLDQKKDIIEKLPTDIQRALVYGYFQLLDTNQTKAPILH